MVGSPFKSKTSASPLGFFKKGGSDKARPIFGRKPKTLLGTPLGKSGSLGGAKPKRGFGRLTVDVAQRGAGFASNKAKEFNEAQKRKKELQEDKFESQENIDDVLEQLEQIEDDEEQRINIIQQTATDPKRAQKRIQKIRKESDREQDKERKKLEKEQEEDRKVTKQLKANEDRINQIALILKPSAFKV